MTVYPFQVTLGGFTITGYGIMLMAAFLVSGWVFARELARAGKDPGLSWDSVVAAVIGGIVGAKLYYALLVQDWSALFSRGGLVWYGGFIGGAAAVATLLWWRRQSILEMGDLVAPALAAGYSVGRVGCFLVGDDYGLPSDVPWAMRFPQGAPPTTAGVLRDQFGVAVPADVPASQVLAVHPTQLYEVFIALAVFLLLWRIRAVVRPKGWLFGVFLALMGMERLFVEIFRAKDDRFLGPFTLAQFFALLSVTVGAALVNGAKGAKGAKGAEGA